MTIARVVDVETSGLPEDDQHAICEIGWIDLEIDTGKISKPAAIDPSYLGWIADKSDMSEDDKFTARHWLQKGSA